MEWPEGHSGQRMILALVCFLDIWLGELSVLTIGGNLCRHSVTAIVAEVSACVRIMK